MSADIRTCAALGCYPVSAVTALTVQNYKGVTCVDAVSPQLLAQQLEAIYEACTPSAVKIGLIPDTATAETAARILEKHHQRNVVLDPVLKATAGGKLAGVDVAEGISRYLIPLCTLTTPNSAEAERIACDNRSAMLVTGGDNDGDTICDTLYYDGDICLEYRTVKIDSPNLHGTGCVLSSAIACGLAHGDDIPEAVARAEDFVHGAIELSARDRIMPYGPCLTQAPANL